MTSFGSVSSTSEKGKLPSNWRCERPEAMQGSRKTRRLCALIALDLRNAFNSATWRRIVEALRNRGIAPYLISIAMSYLSDRTITPKSEETTEENVTCEVPQGLVLGPNLWNTMYDSVLRLLLSNGCTRVGFADDLRLLVVAKTEMTNRATDMIVQWMHSRSLDIAAIKTEAIVFSGRRRLKRIAFRIRGTEILPRVRLNTWG